MSAKAVSSKINRDYAYDATKVDPETIATEAPTVWRRHGTGTYVLMYDVFGAKPVNAMGFSETTDFRTFKDIGRFNEARSPMKATTSFRPSMVRWLRSRRRKRASCRPISRTGAAARRVRA